MRYRQTIFQCTQLSLLCLVLASLCVACAPRFVGPTTPSGYFFTLEAFPSVIWLGVPSSPPAGYPTRAAVVVRIRNGQGQPVDGVPVVFELEPLWAQSVDLAPRQTATRHGLARAVFSQPQTTGVVHITARVDNTTARMRLTVQSYNETWEQDH
jgi:hypothetical protein